MSGTQGASYQMQVFLKENKEITYKLVKAAQEDKDDKDDKDETGGSSRQKSGGNK